MKALQLDLTSGRTFVIDQDDEVFEDTPFCDSEFTITVTPITRPMYSRITKRHTRHVRGQERMDGDAISREVFTAAVIEWSGIEDEGGNPIECNEENKVKVADQFLMFTSLISTAALEAVNRSTRSKQEQVGESNGSGSGD